MIGFALCRALRNVSTWWSASLWGFLLLGSFVSWGTLVARGLGDQRRHGWGLSACLGMAITLWVFGALACVRLAAAPAILLWSAAGPVLWSLDRWRRGEPGRWPSGAAAVRAALRGSYAPLFSLGLALLGVFALLQYAHAVMNTSFNPWDDEMAYRSFVRQFLDTGTLTDGFSFRRVGAYGGQSFLQAMVLAMTDRDRVHLLDNGICLLVAFGLVTGYRSGSRRGTRAAVLVTALLLLTLPYDLHNLGGEYSGLVFFLALFRLYDDPGFEQASPRVNALLGGLLAAAICTLRQNYISAAVLLVALVHLALLWFPGARRREDWLRQGLLTAAATFVFLLPWMVLSTIAIHTPFYPLIRGNVRPDFGILGKVTFDEEVRWTLQNLFMFRPITSIALFFVAAAVLRPVRRHRAIQVFMLTCALAFALMMHFFQSFHDAESINRYYFAFTVAFCLAASLRVLEGGGTRPPLKTTVAAIGLITFAVGYQLVANKEEILREALVDVTAFNDLVRARGPFRRTTLDDLYDRMQAVVPRGAPLLVMLDHGYLFDGKRNRIFDYDHPGTMGPGGGPPAFQGPEALAAYLQKQGIRYLAFQVGPSSREYDVGYWEHMVASAVVINGRGNFYKIQGRFELDSFQTLKALAASRRVLFSEGDLRVLDLGTRSPR
ncbi:MAG TPA: hypothetical protein VHO06_28405 [Polyangia bacterium]|nr:hypothetical protein [Polyangia bacterium]